jgi:hypothetical protein
MYLAPMRFSPARLAPVVSIPRWRVAITGVALIIFLVLLLPIAALALARGVGLAPLPYELFVVLQRLPIIFPLHMVGAALSLILIPIAALLRHRRGAHRIVGRMAAVAVCLGGLSALPVALASKASLAARAGFFVQGLVWLALLAAAIVAIRRGRPAAHGWLMLGMAGVATGAVWLRLTLAAAVAADLPFETVYGLAAWLCWSVPLAIVALSLRGERRLNGGAWSWLRQPNGAERVALCGVSGRR